MRARLDHLRRDRRERLVQFCRDRLVRVDEDALEEDLVKEPLDVIGRTFVQAGALHCHVEGDLDGVLDVDDVLGEASFVALGGCALGADTILLLLEQVERDRVRVVGLEKTELLTFESLQVSPDLRALPLVSSASRTDSAARRPTRT